MPHSGAEYSYFLEAFGSLHKFWGPLPSFVCAFINVCILNPTSTAVIILTFSEYVCHPFAHQMSGMTPESQDMVKKMIAIVGLGEQKKDRLIMYAGPQGEAVAHLQFCHSHPSADPSAYRLKPSPVPEVDVSLSPH